MSQQLAQHPFLWLLLAFLLGLLAEWLLEMFFFRQRLFDAEKLARRRSEELESERYAHGRLQADFRTRVAELDQEQKLRTLAESLLTAAKAKLAETETAQARLADSRTALEAELTAVRGQLDGAGCELAGHRSQVNDLALRHAALEAVARTAEAANGELRANLARLLGDAEAANAALAQVERQLTSETAKAAAYDADLQAALRGQADAQAALGETRSALDAAHLELKARQTEQAALRRELVETASQLAASREAGTGRDQELQRLQAEVETLRGENAAFRENSAKLHDEHAAQTAAATRLAADHERKLAALEAEKTALTTRCEKLETAANDARATAQAAEQKLKARAEEIRGLTAQLGEASEELAELRDKAARFEANLAAAAQTRASLEQEVTRLEAQLASAPAEGVLRDSPASHDEVRELRGQLQENERELAAWESKAKELEAELLVTSQAHRQLAGELERLRSAAPAGDVDAALAAELDAMSRERNALAAELAALKAERPSRKET